MKYLLLLDINLKKEKKKGTTPKKKKEKKPAGKQMPFKAATNTSNYIIKQLKERETEEYYQLKEKEPSVPVFYGTYHHEEEMFFSNEPRLINEVTSNPKMEEIMKPLKVTEETLLDYNEQEKVLISSFRSFKVNIERFH